MAWMENIIYAFVFHERMVFGSRISRSSLSISLDLSACFLSICLLVVLCLLRPAYTFALSFPCVSLPICEGPHVTIFNISITSNVSSLIIQRTNIRTDVGQTSISDGPIKKKKLPSVVYYILPQAYFLGLFMSLLFIFFFFKSKFITEKLF